jgi:hypothetical protein
MADERDDTGRGLRDLAGQGVLADYTKGAGDDEHRRLRAEAYDIAMPVVFGQLTRKIELGRGHYRCAVSVQMLEADCLDRFHDDMDAVLDDIFRNARMPINNLEGWIRKRLTPVTIDAYRRRRGERGALQRPRVPGWLAAKLGEDQELMTLAVEMLDFAGVEVTAGTEVWPIDTWAARRATMTGDYEAARRAVLRDVDTVLAAMRTRPKWHANYVERPLGRKRPPLVPEPRTDPATAEERAARDDADDTRLAELAAVAVAAIEKRLARGETPRAAVVEVLTTVFGAGGVELDRRPGETADVEARLSARLADRAAVDQLVTTVLAILAGGKGC